MATVIEDKPTSDKITPTISNFWKNIYPPLPEYITDRKKMVYVDLFLRIFLYLPAALLNWCFGTTAQLKYFRLFFHCLMRLQGQTTGEDEFMKTTETTFAGVPVRVYEPKKRKGDAAIIFMHGGGFAFCSAASYDFITRYISRRSGLVTVSIDYRLAPEHKYPAAVVDCERAIVHFLTKAHKDYSVDLDKVVLMGDSAGGNLTAVTTQRLREMDIPQPKLQVMIYPWLQILDYQMPSYQKANEYVGTSMINPQAMARFTLHYLVGADIGHYVPDILANRHTTPELRHSPSFDHLRHNILPPEYYSNLSCYNPEKSKPISANLELYGLLQPYLLDPNVSPLLRQGLEGSPKAMIITVEIDPLRDEGILYAEKLKKAGVHVVHKHYPTGFHGSLGPATILGQQQVKDIIDFIREHV